MSIYLKNYKNCSFCGSRKVEKLKLQVFKPNFYVNSIITDLKITKKEISKIKTHECKNCYVKFNNPWFTINISRKIYSNIYGQHNNNWQNLLDYVHKKILPNHGNLFDILSKNLKIKNYAEYNSPFMGLYLNFFHDSFNKKRNNHKFFHKSIMGYLTSRQLAGKSVTNKKNSVIKSKYHLNNINKYKSSINKVNKTLFLDNSSCNWGINDNFKSVNSKAYALEMLDLELKDMKTLTNSKRYDLFGIFHSLDHSDNPKRLLNFALDKSDLVIVQSHNQSKEVSKQHQFSFTQRFVENLPKNKIFVYDLTNIIDKRYKSDELYFLCSKNKSEFKKIKKKLDEYFKKKN